MAIKIDLGKCTGCSKCAEVCPVNAIKIENEKAVVNDECVECGACVSECPNEAISLDREEVQDARRKWNGSIRARSGNRTRHGSRRRSRQNGG